MARQPLAHQLVDVAELNTTGEKIADDQKTKRARLLDQTKSLQDKLDKAKNIISKINEISEPVKDTKLVYDLLAPVKEVVYFVDAFADVHPAFKFVASIAKTVIDMELKRRENDKQIALVYCTMSSTLFLLAEIDDVFRDGERLKDSLESKLKEVCKVITDFGSFCEIYYQQKGFVKTLRSGKYKDKLSDFSTGFDSQKEQLHALLSAQASLTIIDVKLDVRKVKELLQARSEKEQQLEKLIKDMGGWDAVAKDEKRLEELAKKMGESFDASVRRNLKIDLDEALEKNRTLFSNKIDLSTEQIQDSVKISTATIIKTLERGPHEFIEDEDIKTIWRDMPSRTSAKTRQFLDAVHGYFQRKFVHYQYDNDKPHRDAWTLYFLSKVIFYPAIGDGIDDDSSGFLSVHEVNNFLKSKPEAMQCSAVAWITFWAIGSHMTDVEHLNAIEDLISELEEAPGNVRSENRKRVRYFASIVKPLKCIKVHKKALACLDEDEDEIEEYETLHQLRRVWRTSETNRIKSNLRRLSYELPRFDYLQAVLGDRRLEHCVMTLIRVLLERHIQVVRLAKKEVISVQEFQDMRDTWNCIFWALDRRLDVLQQVWRQQRLDPEAQVESYNGGLFEAWYDLKQSMIDMDLGSEYDDDDGTYNFDDYDSDDNDDDEEESGDEDDHASRKTRATDANTDGHSTPPESLLHYSLGGDSDDDAGLTTVEDDSDWEPPVTRKIKAEKEIKQRLTNVEEKLAEISSMLSQLLQARGVHPTLTASSYHLNPPQPDSPSHAPFATTDDVDMHARETPELDHPGADDHDDVPEEQGAEDSADDDCNARWGRSSFREDDDEGGQEEGEEGERAEEEGEREETDDEAAYHSYRGGRGGTSWNDHEEDDD